MAGDGDDGYHGIGMVGRLTLRQIPEDAKAINLDEHAALEGPSRYFQNKMGGLTNELKGQAQRIADAIAEAGHSPGLLKRLSEIEKQISDLDRKTAVSRSCEMELTPSQLRDFVRQRLLNLPALLRDNVERAKRELLENVKEIVLTPVNNTRYAISGNWEMLPAADGVKTIVARDGVEPPTPVFSELGFPVFPTTSMVVEGPLNTGKNG